ncbi:DNA topoisomerase 2 [Neolecta irregularis DAH-3]|uniref:DNA topoisomerase 2 n=1 Tax=Neolecta irregularis (strain DAH-3) TaxID=1198029 RepID=A0A1U7LU04_NEOID|nr:DNA topoisomerase 2 [Neolecta irregularis DAH-3]|eukprot:OLL26098.1 DNA topoisomerase 2 [Neolecta irregularis DAH-3]
MASTALVVDISDSDDFVPHRIVTNTKPAKKAAPAKKTLVNSDLDEDDDCSVMDAHDQPKPKKKPPTKPKVAKPKVQKPIKNIPVSNEDDSGMFQDPQTDSSFPESKPTPNGALKPIENELDLDHPAAKKPSGSKNATEQYQKLSQLEHVLKRPDTYIGSREQHNAIQASLLLPDCLISRQATIVPGFYKIFDEILVNAADNKQRDPSMTQIKVTFDREKNEISVMNDGKGIPVEIHAKEKIYIPELIFGNLLTSSNYDDDQKKVTGGRNGYGAKLCNIFSTEFIVETANKKSGKKYKQIWTDNMTVKTKPKISENKKGEEYTKITFKPDLAKFDMEVMDDDIEGVIKRRVYDIAGCVKGIKVYLNGTLLKINSFKKYIDLYVNSKTAEEGGTERKVYHEIVSDRWEVAVTHSDGQFNQVSFVNSIATTRGGTHVDMVTDQIVKKLAEIIKKKKAHPIKNFQIKNQMWVFVNSLVENPAFDSQTKETLTLKNSAFGSKCVLSEEFIKKVSKSAIVENIMNFSLVRADKELQKSDGSKRSRITGIPKLEDANNAGTKNAHRCTLILTEGDSAKTLAVAGMSVVGRDNFGGKMLNVRDASAAQVSANAEIQAIKRIMGLQHAKAYTSTAELRYGHLMIMTDQDHDGSHIKGLIINYFEKFYPSLLKIPDFLIEFITPIVRCTKKTNKKQTIDFFTLPEYEHWKEANNGGAGWDQKYFKGLGTSKAEDAKRYFSDLDRHLKYFHAMQEGDRILVDLAFSKKKADERKDWLRDFIPGTYLDNSMEKIPISDFINKELILFSMADNIRSIPSVVDGLKPGQRKVIYGLFLKNLRGEIKVAQLGGYVGEKTQYHHGEQSLNMTIIGLAQSFVGSNNVNLLLPNGQFGTRLQGGKDAASARYIFTNLSPLARKLYIQTDNPLLNWLVEEGEQIEPEWYMPILPMVLVNGSEGIGTGWSSSIPNYNPEDIIINLRRLMNGEEVLLMDPWYRGFRGTIEKKDDKQGTYKVTGTIRQVDDTNVEITELPVRYWSQTMKEFLEAGIAGTDKQPAFIKDYNDNNTDTAVQFTVRLTEQGMADALREGLETKFKLTATINTSNMVAFDSQGRLKKYANPEQILIEFYHLRLQFYQKRKDHLADELGKQLDRLSNQVRFIKMIISKELVVSNRKKAEIVTELRERKFTSFPKKKQAKIAGENVETLDGEDDAVEDGKEDPANGYDYLLGKIVEKLLKDHELKESELNELLKLSAKDLWNIDLDQFLEEWEVALKEDEIARTNGKSITSNGSKLGRAKKPAAVKSKKRQSLTDDDADEDFQSKKLKKAPSVKKEVGSKKQSTLAFKKTDTKTATNTDITPPHVEVPVNKSKAPAKRKVAVASYSDEDIKPIVSKRVPAAPTLFSDEDEPVGHSTIIKGESDADGDTEKKGYASKPEPKKIVQATMDESEDEPADDDDDDFGIVSEEEKPVIKAKAKGASGGQKAVQKKRKIAVDSDDSLGQIQPIVARAPRATAPKKPIIETESDSDEVITDESFEDDDEY